METTNREMLYTTAAFDRQMIFGGTRPFVVAFFDACPAVDVWYQIMKLDDLLFRTTMSSYKHFTPKITQYYVPDDGYSFRL